MAKIMHPKMQFLGDTYISEKLCAFVPALLVILGRVMVMQDFAWNILIFGMFQGGLKCSTA